MESNNEFGNITFDLPKNQSNVIKVIGVGGGGSNAINHMFRQGIIGVDFVVCNTDSQALQTSPVPNKIQLGVNLTEGLGAGAKPEIGQQAALESIEEIEKIGGMTQAINAGIPQRMIEDSAAKRQANIDSNNELIIGLNSHYSNEKYEFDILQINNEEVRKNQLSRLHKVRSSRDHAKVEKNLEALTEAAKNNTGNLLALSIEAARNRATLGEISFALEKVYSRHLPKNNLTSGVYSSAFQNKNDWQLVMEEIKAFANKHGRPPRILISKLGQDGHDRGAKVIATAFADLGFDVDLGQLFQTPQECVKQAIENDVHLIGISSLAAGHKTLVPEVIKELKRNLREDIRVIVGGVIPKQDYDFLYQHGVLGIFGTGTKIPEAASEIIKKIITFKNE